MSSKLASAQDRMNACLSDFHNALAIPRVRARLSVSDGERF